MLNIKKFFRENLDIELSYGFLIVTLLLLFAVKRSCTGAGCIFGLVLVLFLLFDSIIFTVVALIKGFRKKSVFKLVFSLGASIVIVFALVFILLNVKF